MDTLIASQIAGLVDFRTVGQSDHAITAEEYDMAVAVGYELANLHGMDLGAHIAGQEQRERDEKNQNYPD